MLYGYCSQCHGKSGGGSKLARAPAIAGLGEWYVQAQLDKFRNGARGDHPDDVDGLRMRPMSRTLMNDGDVRLVAAYVAGLPIPEPAPTLTGGDATAGATLYAPCSACHGEHGEGKREVNGPALTHTGDWYLLAQLEKFKAGVRGTDPLDQTGAQMRPMAMTLGDDQAMKNVIAYIMTLN